MSWEWSGYSAKVFPYRKFEHVTHQRAAAAKLETLLRPGERRRRLAEIAVDSGTLRRWQRWLWSTLPPPGADHALGNFLARVGETAAAERPLLEAAEASPGFFEPHLDLGLVYRELGLRGAAMRSLRNAKTLAPDHPDLAPIAAWRNDGT